MLDGTRSGGRKGLVGAVVVALVSGVTVLGWAPAASAAPLYAVVATVPLGSPAGDGLAIDRANNSLFVSKPAANVVSVIDLTSNTVKATIPIPGSPGRMAVDPVAHRVYVVTSSSTLTVFDTTTNTVVDTIGGLSNPIGVAVDPGTHTVYVANYVSQTVSVIDTTASPATVANTDIVGSRPWAIAVDPISHPAYVATLFGGTVAVISGTTIVKTLGGFIGPIQVTVDPSTQHAYVINNNSDNVSVIDTTTDTGAASFTAGSGPSDIAVDPRTHTAFVTNRNDDTVSVIDQDSNTVVDTVPVGETPVTVEVDPATHRVYVTNSDSTISVIGAPFASQEIIFTSVVPAGASVGGSHTVTATGGISGNPVTFSTASPACTVTSGGQVAFIHAGACVIAADQAGSSSTTDAPTATQAIDVGRAAQAIIFTSLPPSAATVGDSYPVSATGGASNQPITFSVDPATTNTACSVTASTVSFDHAGICVVAADQAGTTDYTAAPTTTQQMAVDLVETTAVVTLPTSGVVFGQAATGTVAVSGTHDGSVQFTLDGTPVGSAVVLAQDGTATSPNLVGSGLAVGSHPVGAVFTPTDDDRYAGSNATPQNLTVSKAATTSSVSVDANHVTASVTPTPPGAGAPTGTVQFYLAGTAIGSVPLRPYSDPALPGCHRKHPGGLHGLHRRRRLHRLLGLDGTPGPGDHRHRVEQDGTPARLARDAGDGYLPLPADQRRVDQALPGSGDAVAQRGWAVGHPHDHGHRRRYGHSRGQAHQHRQGPAHRPSDRGPRRCDVLRHRTGRRLPRDRQTVRDRRLQSGAHGARTPSELRRHRDGPGGQPQQYPAGRPHHVGGHQRGLKEGRALRRPPRPHVYGAGRCDNASDLHLRGPGTPPTGRWRPPDEAGRQESMGAGCDLHACHEPVPPLEHRHPCRHPHHGHNRARRALNAATASGTATTADCVGGKRRVQAASTDRQPLSLLAHPVRAARARPNRWCEPARPHAGARGATVRRHVGTPA